MLHLTLRQLEIFCAVAQSGSTVAAAEVVGLSQSATSAALQQLEVALNTQVFERVGRNLVLNDAGRALLPQALSVLEQVRGMEQAFAGTGGGGLPVRLCVAASTTVGSYVLPPVLALLARSHPHISVDVRIANTREVEHAVQALEVDVGLIEGSSHGVGLAVQPWIADELVVVAAPGDALVQAAQTKPVGVAMLRQARWLLREEGSGTREMVEIRLAAAPAPVARRGGAGQLRGDCALCGAGLGHQLFAPGAGAIDAQRWQPGGAAHIAAPHGAALLHRATRGQACARRVAGLFGCLRRAGGAAGGCGGRFKNKQLLALYLQGFAVYFDLKCFQIKRRASSYFCSGLFHRNRGAARHGHGRHAVWGEPSITRSE